MLDALLQDVRRDVSGEAAGAAVLNHDGEGDLRVVGGGEADEPGVVERGAVLAPAAVPGRRQSRQGRATARVPRPRGSPAGGVEAP